MGACSSRSTSTRAPTLRACSPQILNNPASRRNYDHYGQLPEGTKKQRVVVSIGLPSWMAGDGSGQWLLIAAYGLLLVLAVPIGLTYALRPAPKKKADDE